MWQTTKRASTKASGNENGKASISPIIMCSTLLCFSCRYKADKGRRHAANPGEEGRVLGRCLATVEHPWQSVTSIGQPKSK